MKILSPLDSLIKSGNLLLLPRAVAAQPSKTALALNRPLPSSPTPMFSCARNAAACLPKLLLLLLLIVSWPPPSVSNPAPSPPPPPTPPTEQDFLLNIHALENQLRAQRQALAALQDARTRSERAADATATTTLDKSDSRQVCALEDGVGQNGECASPDEQFKLVGSRVLGYAAKAAIWLPWMVSHASLYLCIAGADGALHVYSRSGGFKASHPLPPTCDPTSIDVSGFKTDVVVFIAVGCADASFAVLSISGPPSRPLARFVPGTPAAFASADVSKLPPDTWIPTISLVNHTPPPSPSTTPQSLVIPDDFYPAPPPALPDSIRHVVAVHRQRIPSFLYVTAGGRIVLTSRNGTLLGVGRVTEAHLPITAARYLSHSFALLATQQGAAIWDFRLMSSVSSCTETVLEDLPVTSSQKQADSEQRHETRSVRRPFTRPLIAAAQEATSADSRSVHVLDSSASIITLSVKVDRSRVKCHVLHEVPGAVPSAPPPSLTGMRGGFAAACASHINVFRATPDAPGTAGVALEIQMPVRTSPSSLSTAPASGSHLTAGDGSYVLAVVAADGTLSMYQVRAGSRCCSRPAAYLRPRAPCCLPRTRTLRHLHRVSPSGTWFPPLYETLSLPS
jgi:hypothetical protein